MIENKELILENLISFRGRLSQTEIQKEMESLMEFLKEKRINKIGPMVNTTFGVEIINGQQIADTEFMIPVDKKVDFSEKYRFKENFHLVNAIYAKHKGNPIGLQSLYEKANKYSLEKGLQFITSGYNVFINEASNPDDFEIDVYIGVNPNKL